MSHFPLKRGIFCSHFWVLTVVSSILTTFRNTSFRIPRNLIKWDKQALIDFGGSTFSLICCHNTKIVAYCGTYLLPWILRLLHTVAIFGGTELLFEMIEPDWILVASFLLIWFGSCSLVYRKSCNNLLDFAFFGCRKEVSASLSRISKSR